MALCPAHDDHDPSLSVSEGDGGKVILHCFAGCELEAILDAAGLGWSDLFPASSKVGGEGYYPPPENVGNVGTPRGCTIADYSAAKDLPIEVLKGLAVSEIANYNGAPAVRFGYLNQDDEEVCVRFRVSLDGSPKIKTRKGDKATLYGLWKLEEAREKEHVIAVEGESDTQTLWHHGFPAVGIPGASSWKSEWAAHLEGIERVYVVVEPDAAGENLWERMTASPLREQLYRIELNDFKDVSEMHLDSPERFSDRLGVELASATSYMDIAESEAKAAKREAWAKCEGLAKEGRILDHFAIDLKSSGVAGEARAGQLLYLALNSRHLDAKQLVNVGVKGPSSAGKSYVVEKVCEFFPADAYHLLTAMSEKILAYSEEPISHRFLILVEAAGMSGEFASYLIRSLLSEGRLRYETVESTKDGIRPKLIEREGPTGLIVTTTKTRLHGENETRMLSVRVDDTPDHTSEILAALADEDSGSPDLERWRALQVWIATGEKHVSIPYAKTLAGMVPPVAVRLRRDFGAVLNLIRSHALLHRESRERDEQDRIIATIEDYAVVRELVADLISEGVEATIPQIVREAVEKATELIEDNNGEPVTISAIGKALDPPLERNATHRRVTMAIDGGYLKNKETRERHPAQIVKGELLPEDREILPAPAALTAKVEGRDVPTFPKVSEEGSTPSPPTGEDIEGGDDQELPF